MSSGVSIPATQGAELPAVVQQVLAVAPETHWAAVGIDPIEVWVCSVPDDTQASIYAGLPLRLTLTPDDVVAVFEAQVVPYFDSISHGDYSPSFRVGGTIEMSAEDGPKDCLDDALDRSAPTSAAVFAVADAEHGGDEPGGFGSAGAPCAVPPCPASVTRRAAYIGASDLHPDWGVSKPVDLAQHEIGHTLGWAHSGVDDGGAYLSALDVMSNSAAPREVDDRRRDGPDTIALNRLLSGWLPLTDVWTVPPAGGTVELAPSTGTEGRRLAILPVDDRRFLTAEVLVAEGWNGHLPSSGVTVHLVEVDAGVVQRCTPVVGAAPFDQLLSTAGPRSVTVEGWRIEVLRDGPARWTVTIVPSVGS